MRILVTGGAGFIGSHLSQALLEQGHLVTVVDDFNDYYSPAIKRKNIFALIDNPKFQLHEIDITDGPEMARVYKDFKPEAVYHLAARAGVRPSLENPELYERVNVGGTIVLLNLSVENGVKNFIFGSTSSIYGITSQVPFKETDPVSCPISPYAVTKRAAEQMCFVYSHNYGLPVTCLRFFTVYGPRQRPEMAIHKFTRQISNEEEVAVFGDGSSERDYTFVEDILQGLLRCLDKPMKYEIINLGNNKRIKLLDLIRMIEKVLGKKANVKFESEKKGDVPLTCADIDKASKLLGYLPQTPIEKGIKVFVDWYRENS